MDHCRTLRNLLVVVRHHGKEIRMTRVGAILIGDGIDHWKLSQEFLHNEAKDRFDMPLEKRVVLYRDSYIELHINPLFKDEEQKR
jgi:hypothetical protein